MPFYSMGVQVRPENGEKQSRGRSLRLQRNARSRDFIEGILCAPRGCVSRFVGFCGLRESPPTSQKEKMVAGKFLARHFLAIQQAVESGGLANVYWLPGLENPADSLAKIKSDMVPLLRMMESGCYNPGLLRPLRGLPSNETPF